MKLSALLLILSLAFTVLVTTAQDSRFIPAFSVIFDSAYGENLLKQCSRSYPKDAKSFWNLSQGDINNLEINFKNIYSASAKECCIVGARVDSLGRFGFQYLGVFVNGKKQIYINSFPLTQVNYFKEHNLDPAKSSMVVCDGGSAFWGVIFDIESKIFISLAFNGEG